MKASFFSELKKRRVYRSAVAYAIVAWSVTEVLDGVIAGLGWPDWLATLAVIVFVTGFPVAMFLAWVYDWTPEGIRRTAPSGPLGWLPAALAFVFLVTGSGGLFWLINPSGVARAEQVGIAVLPCRYRGESELAYRGPGIAELINDGLARSDRLFVPAFRSVAAIVASGSVTSELAERLGIEWLVDCRVTGLEDGINIAASIVLVATDESVELFDRDLRSLEIADALLEVNRAIYRRLSLPPPPVGRSPDLTPSMRALDAYLLGLEGLRDGTAAGLGSARGYFQEAQEAGAFPLARLREADAMLRLFELDPPASPAAALRAVALMLHEVEQPGDAPAELYALRLRAANLADRLDTQNRVSEQQRQAWFGLATELRPNFAEPYRLYAEFLEQEGRDREADDYRAQARRLEPAFR